MDLDKNKILNKNEIRHQIDESMGLFYFSIIDIIDALDLSTDPRNYWKVLKNRFKKSDNKLAMECNQLKMKSSDGKYYLTDVATPHTLLKIIEIINPEKVSIFSEYFNSVEKENYTQINHNYLNNDNLYKGSYEEGEIQVDLFQKENFLFIKAMLAGVNPEEIFISLDTKVLTLKINRVKQNNINNDLYSHQELAYGKFERVINLPYEVDIDKVETTSYYGLLQIKLSILDKTRTKIIKVK